MYRIVMPLVIYKLVHSGLFIGAHPPFITYYTECTAKTPDSLIGT